MCVRFIIFYFILFYFYHVFFPVYRPHTPEERGHVVVETLFVLDVSFSAERRTSEVAPHHILEHTEEDTHSVY